MTIITRNTIRRGFLPLCALVLTFPVLAGTPHDGQDPAAAAADWQTSVENLMAGARSGQPQTPAERHAALVNRAATDGTVPVIVRFKEAAPDPAVPESEIQAARALKRQDALNRLGLAAGRDRAGAKIKEFSHMGGFALRADATDIVDLANNPEVLDVVEDFAYPPALLESVPLIGALDGAFDGYTGLGQVVAILDTGVDKSHPFLTGKVISEACYSSNDTANGIYSLCPEGVTTATTTGSAANCSATQWGSGCNHGTHVAGIVAGSNAGYSGVAKDARLIAIQVFSGFPSTSCGTTGTPCVLAYTSDIIRGLERVYTLRTTYTIASANLSLGGGSYTSNCDTDATKPAIDSLRAAGIATVIASGNNSYTNSISAPACISSAISVGATCDAAGGFCAGVDAVASYSNSAAFLSLLAPGSAITSSVPGGGYSSWDGTSMATPHVAGAWAVIKQARSSASVDEVLAALKATGTPVTDARNGIAIPLIQPAAAIDSLASVLPPSATTATAATSITSSGFTANWGAAAGAAGYRLDVSTSASFASYLSGYQNLDLGKATSRTITGLTAGTIYYYRVRAYNVGGTSGDSNVQTVTTMAAPPAAPALTSAKNITKTGFQVNWTAITGATGYRLDVSTNSSFSALVSGYSNLDVGNVNNRTVAGLRSNTNYYVRLRAYSTAGTSASSKTMTIKTAR